MIFGGANQGLTMTLRVISYAYALLIFTAVPFVGSLIALVWLLVLTIIGLAAAHRTDIWRTALAILVPTVLCVCAISLLYSANIVDLLEGTTRKPIP
ncbi:MAG: YIP1 family protein [Armatimonadota bacterium]